VGLIATLEATSALLFGAALVFGLVSGTNDGGTLVSFATRTAVIPPGIAVAVLVLVITAGPMVLGTKVATTVARRLVSFGGTDGRLSLLAAVVVALVVVIVLARRGLPTSVTLALMGGIAGTAAGDGLHVAWAILGSVLLVGLLAPLASVAVALGLTKMLLVLPASWLMGRGGDALQGMGLFAQALAYAGNDAQKIVAIFAVASGDIGSRVTLDWRDQLALGGAYALGILLGVRPLASRVAEQVLPVRPVNAVALELSASAVVFASSALGAPISSTQAATTALVGSGIATGSHRLRWQEVSSIAFAWLLTLPSSLLLGWLIGLGVRAAR
jgi:PiT family inorganic phosphate transporter